MSLCMLQEEIEKIGKCTEGSSETVKIEVLVAIMNIIILETLEASSNDWQVHLRAGMTLLISMIPNDLIPNDEAVNQRTLANTIYNSAKVETPRMTSITFCSAAQSFLANIFVWFDALSSALFWDNREELDYTTILACYQVNITSPFGCKNWVVAAIGKTNQLRRWKVLMANQGSLSNILLATRVSEVEQFIRAHLSSQESFLTPYDAFDLSTHIFAQASIVYLHVVASGPYPDVPEIRDSVESCLAHVRLTPGLLTSFWLAWPVCIIGCMAAKDLRKSFEEVLEGRDISHHGNFGFTNALAVMRDCWRLRDLNIYPADWTSSMRSLGYTFLLI
ncbi:hypothetical protein BP6252_08213 [Coleophoma cylindrospora]|uniref:Uncharacterized protein n=1 Tax=Coleophoma cylindrospora TaxID=1849047 RepID=A0A3D8R584_9HELO|nr:hypothetical protein BP6252_08213 [Coleophoma cylindrospora]